MRRPLCLFVLVSSMACGSSATAPGMSRLESRPVDAPQLEERDSADATQARPSQFNGTVAGFGLTPRSTIFLQGVAHMGEPQPILVMLQADVPNLCAHMQAGTMPKNSTLFAAVIIQTQGGPFSVGHPGYTAPAHHEMDNDPLSMAVFRKLDGTCQAAPTETGLELEQGRVVLRSLVPFEHVEADYAFAQGEDAIDGHIEAEHCDAPEFFTDLGKFYAPVEPEHCR